MSLFAVKAHPAPLLHVIPRTAFAASATALSTFLLQYSPPPLSLRHLPHASRHVRPRTIFPFPSSARLQLTAITPLPSAPLQDPEAAPGPAAGAARGFHLHGTAVLPRTVLPDRETRRDTGLAIPRTENRGRRDHTRSFSPTLI